MRDRAVTMQLAAAGVATVPVIGALHLECFDDPWSETSIAEVLGSPGVFAYIGLVPSGNGAGGEPCGFAIVRVTGDEAELLSIGIASRWRRRGYARRLLDAVLASIDKRRVRRIFLEVAEDNTPARALYLAYGFAQVGRRDAYYRRPSGSVAALTMCRTLAKSRLGWAAARP